MNSAFTPFRSALRRAVSIGRKSDADSKIMLSKSIAKNRITAIACTPVFDSGGELRHLLYVDNQERESEFSVRDTELLVWLGQTYSLLYENIEMGRRLQMEVAELKRSAVRDAEVIAESPPMVLLLERVRKAAATFAPADSDDPGAVSITVVQRKRQK